MLPYLTPQEQDELDRLLSGVEVPPWSPFGPDSEGNPSPQQQALDCKADILLYGGAAGGGKTDLLLGCALIQAQKAIIFRREFAQLKGIRERADELYGELGKFNGGLELWRLKEGKYKGKRIEFGAVQNVGDEKKYQGRPHDHKLFDEIPLFTEDQFRFLCTWKRTTVKGQRVRVIAAGNPPTDAEGDWVIRYWAAWLDPLHPNPAKPGELRWYVSDNEGRDLEVPSRDAGYVGPDNTWSHTCPAGQDATRDLVRPESRSFIPARVEDNPILMSTGYKATLQALPEPLKSRMLKGDFGVGRVDAEWQVIPTDWVVQAQARWTPTYEEFLRTRETVKAQQLEQLQASSDSRDPTLQLGMPSSPLATTHVFGRPALQKSGPEDGVDSRARQEIENGIQRLVEAAAKGREVGADVARGGKDRTIFTERVGLWFAEQVVIPGKQTKEGLDIVMALVKLGFLQIPIKMDVGNIGASPVDIGKMHGLNIIPMNGAEKSVAKDRSGKLGFVNLRAEWHWGLREALDPVLGYGLALPPDPELRADLTAARWKLTPRGIKIEDKQDIKDRIHRSPDKGESLVYANATPRLPGAAYLQYYEEASRLMREQLDAVEHRRIPHGSGHGTVQPLA